MGNCLMACMCYKLKEEEQKCDCVRVDVVSVDESTDSLPDLKDPSSDSTEEEQEGEVWF